MSETNSPLAKVWISILSIAARARDLTSFQDERLSAIENRLAALDGENSSEAAKRAALTAANDKRISNRMDPLGFRFVGSEDSMAIEWTSKEARGR